MSNKTLELINQFVIKTKHYILCDDIANDDMQNIFLESIDNNIDASNQFLAGLKELKSALKEDLSFFMSSDPAAISEEEILIAYPGYKAIAYYRVAHVLHGLGYKLEARIVTELAHSMTGIDIHPGADIGYPFFIDHGTGIVIGETSIIGKNVKMYQGVTLGALSLSKGSKMHGIKRHPTIGNNVTIYAGASILGNIKIGNDVTIGSNVFVTEDIPSNSRVTIGKPTLIITKK